jgi:hypothetical protein
VIALRRLFQKRSQFFPQFSATTVDNFLDDGSHFQWRVLLKLVRVIETEAI